MGCVKNCKAARDWKCNKNFKITGTCLKILKSPSLKNFKVTIFDRL
jgi:hypothetical protein